MIYKVQLKDQINNFYSTDNDVFSVVSEDGIQKKYLKEIVEGDVLVGSNSYNDFLNNPFEIDFKSKNFWHQGKLTLELAEFLGYFISFDPKIGKNCIYINNPASIDVFYNLFNETFPSIESSYRIYDKKLIIETDYSVIDFFYYLGLFFENHGVPRCIKESSNEYISAFLTGFLKNKQDLCSKNNIYYFQIKDLSFKLAKEIQLILDLLGVYSIAENNNELYNLKITSNSNMQRLISCVSLENLDKVKITNNNYCLKTGIKSEKLQALVLGKSNSDDVLYDISDLENKINFDGSKNIHYFNFPLYAVDKIELKEVTSNDIIDYPCFFTFDERAVIKQGE